MRLHPQKIYKNKQPEFLVLPIKEYQNLISYMEDFQDIQEIKAQIAENEETFPIEVAQALIEGHHPVKVFREYRKISQSDLAKGIGVSKQYISQIENRDSVGPTKIMKSIAKHLNLDLEDLI